MWVSEYKFSISTTSAIRLNLTPEDKLVAFENNNEWYISKTDKDDVDGYHLSKGTKGQVTFTSRHLARKLLKAFGTADLILKPTEFHYKNHPVYKLDERISKIILNGKPNRAIDFGVHGEERDME